MPAEIRCPQCRQSLTQVGKHWVCPEHGQVSMDKQCAQFRIFLSYGHDANEELVRRIKADLEKRGHDVWFDKNEIKFGDDWRRAITDGIVGSNRVLSFLSKHSTRDPGVCRDEIAIAIGVKGGNIQTILVESEQEVQPPVNIGHIQWLDMHDWKERRAAGETAWEQWYQAKLAEIVRVVESDESRRFAGEIDTLNGHLKPIKSEARICQLLSKGFCGRQWLFEAVEKWRQDTKQNSRLFWIIGAPGVGKSAFAAQLTHTRGDTVIAAQFCEWDKPDHRNAPWVVRSLAFQLATRLPDYRKLLLTLPEIAELDRKDAAELFDYLLANPLRSVIHGGRERYLIVIDALDEAGEAGRNPLVEMLARNAQRLPDWLGLVVTSRPEFDVKTPLQALNPFPLDTQSESNRADIRDYLRYELASHLQNRPDADHLVEQILEKSEGVFLYVERFCDDVHHGHLSLDHPEQFPQALGGIFFQWFQRQFPDLEKFRKDVRPALRAILAAREPLPVEILQRLFNWQDAELRDFTRPIASLFPVTKEADSEVIKPYHKSLTDYLMDEAKAGTYFIDLKSGHALLAEMGAREFAESTAPLCPYFLKFLPLHLADAQHYDKLRCLLSDDRFASLIYEQRTFLPQGTLFQDTAHRFYSVQTLISRLPLHDTYSCHSIVNNEPLALRITHDTSDRTMQALDLLMGLEVVSPRLERGIGVVRTPAWSGLVSEWLDGWDMPGVGRIVQLRCIPVKTAQQHAVRIALEILEGLQSLHANRVLYGSLTPDTVFFRADGSVVLALIGIVTREPCKVAAPAITYGSMPYVPPDGFRKPQPSVASDLHSVADLLAWMLSGKTYRMEQPVDDSILSSGDDMWSLHRDVEQIPNLSPQFLAVIQCAQSRNHGYLTAKEMYLSLLDVSLTPSVSRTEARKPWWKVW